MRPRSFAFIVAVILTTSQVAGVICQMDCDQIATTPTCHQSATSSHGPAVRVSRQVCDHDHSLGGPALLASASARDSSETFDALPVTALASASLADARVSVCGAHGPPGLSGRSTSLTIVILRI